VTELGDHARLGEEATHDAVIVGQFGMHNLDGDTGRA
jgi:hypothetical protein